MISLTGVAFVPGGAIQKTRRFAPFRVDGPFIGAKVAAIGLRDGMTYPQRGTSLAGVNGEFSIHEIPSGQHDLVAARKGNMVLMKPVAVPENPPGAMEIGEVDATSTSVALMLEHFIREELKLNERFDLSRGNNGVDPQKLSEAIKNADLEALTKKVTELIDQVNTLGDDLEALKQELAANNGRDDQGAIVNIYNTVIQIVIVSNENGNGEGPDALREWRDTGKVGGVSVIVPRVEVIVDDQGLLVEVHIEYVDVKPIDLFEFLKKITKPQTTIIDAPLKNTPSRSARFTFDFSRDCSTFECQLDGGGFSVCVTPKEYQELSVARHTFCVTATDKEGAKDPTSCESLCEDFEDGIDPWFPETGVWQVGTPTAGPTSCHSGSQCAGTVLDGNYHAFTDSRLVGPSITLPTVTGTEEIRLRFWNWFSYSSFDSGQVQIQVFDDVSGTWEQTWKDEGLPVSSFSGGWNLKGDVNNLCRKEDSDCLLSCSGKGLLQCE